MGVHYDQSDLKAIGAQCKNKLPPASAVQAMFLYEMQRESEVEARFHGQMFRLAKAEEETKSQESRISDLEEQTKDLGKKLAANDTTERLANSKVRTDALQSKLNEQTQRVDEHAKRLSDLETTTKAAAAAPANPPSFLLSSDVNTLKTDFEKADTEIQTLFDERDALITLLNQSNARIDKLEDLVRALTLQKTSPSDSTDGTRTPPVQFLPVKTKNGENVDLAVPKGQGFKGEVKTFVPGKPLGRGGSASPAAMPVQPMPLKEKKGENVDPAMSKGKASVSLSRDEIKAFVPGELWVSSSSPNTATPPRPLSYVGSPTIAPHRRKEVVW